MKFYKPDFGYLTYLHSADKHIILSEDLIGIVIRLHEMIYFVPVDSIRESDYDERHNMRKTTPSILRMFDTRKEENLGKCLFSNMFPIPYKALIPLEITQFDMQTRSIATKKLEYIKQQEDRIMKAAMRLYNQKTKHYNQPYLSVTVDFQRLEKEAREFEIKHYKKHYNRFPDSKYFLSNPNIVGITEYFLMNKKTKVAKIKYDNENHRVVEIEKTYLPEFAPLECFKSKKMTPLAMTEWFRGRGIPSWRDDLDDFLDNLGVKNKDTLLNKAFGLSLSDQYWLNPVDMRMEWDDINFFDHDFNSNDYQNATFENKMLDIKEVDLYSPNNTSDGMLRKTWISGDDGKRYLLKGSYHEQGMEPFNEVLASWICDVLELDHVTYSLEVIHRNMVSKCECFVDKETELLSAYSILHFQGIELSPTNQNVYKEYVNILKSEGLKDVEVSLAKMFVHDYMIANADRHLGNFGVIRNVETLKWMKLAPNFDSGQALLSQKKVYEMNFNHVAGIFFTKKDVDFESILKEVIDSISFEINFSGLFNISNQWKELLITYQDASQLSLEKIETVYQGLRQRISMLKSKLENK